MNQSALNVSTPPSINSSDAMTSMATENVSVEDGKNRFFTGFHYNRLAAQIYESCTFAVGSVGSVANGFVLLALLCARQSRRKNINVFIIHQTVLDLLACLFLMLTLVSYRFETPSMAGKWIICLRTGDRWSTYRPSKMSRIWIICLLFGTNTVVAVASYSSIFGLVVITVERYVKIVCPVIHRNHYRRWMTYAGVILPWVDGCCCYLIPAWSTVKMMNGKCMRFVWPTPGMFSAYTLTMFFWHYVMPPAFFLFAYWSIIGVIRHHAPFQQ